MKVNSTTVKPDFDTFLIWKSVFLCYFKYDYLSLAILCQLEMKDDEYVHTFTRRRYECIQLSSIDYSILFVFHIFSLMIQIVFILDFIEYVKGLDAENAPR